MFNGRPWLTTTECVIDGSEHVPFIVIIIRSFPIWVVTGFVTRVTRWVSHMELLALLGLWFLVEFMLLGFLCSVLWIIACPFVFFIWPLCCLSFDLRLLITHLVSSNFSFSY